MFLYVLCLLMEEKTFLHFPGIEPQLHLGRVAVTCYCGLCVAKFVHAERKNPYLMCCIMTRVSAWDELTQKVYAYGVVIITDLIKQSACLQFFCFRIIYVIGWCGT
jgi:hypothetical protein